MGIVIGNKIYRQPSDGYAARFLRHATVGFSEEDIYSVQDDPEGYWGWIQKQMSVKDVPPVGSENMYHVDDPSLDHFSWVKVKIGGDVSTAQTLVRSMLPGDPSLSEFPYKPYAFVSSFLRKAITTREKLRLKTAYALSQILVVSGVAGLDDEVVYLKLAGYFDVLHENAFKTYEELLFEVSKNVVMGEFLTFLGSQKSGGGREPDENYARELLQLFTIGPDALDMGTGEVVYKGVEGSRPVANESYSSKEVAAAAKLFTGWVVRADLVADPERFRGVDAYTRVGRTVPVLQRGNVALVNMPDLHDASAVEVRFPQYSAATGGRLSDYIISVPSGLSAEDRIKYFISKIVRHPNTAYHVAKLLIQRFVTSNPSQGYINSVAAAFRCEVDGKMGDMQAVVKAILLNDCLFVNNAIYNELERSGSDFIKSSSGSLVSGAAQFGKIVEPFMRLTNWAIAFQAKNANCYSVCWTDAPIYSGLQLGQAPLCAPSVFNFYRPGYVPSNSLFAAQTRVSTIGSATYTTHLVAPEAQITNGLTMTAYADFMASAIDPDVGVGGVGHIISDYAEWEAAAVGVNEQLDPMLDRMGLVLCGGVFSGATRAIVRDRLNTLPFETVEQRKIRVQVAILLIMISPDYLVQQ